MYKHRSSSKDVPNNQIQRDNNVHPVQGTSEDSGLPSLDLAFDLVKERMTGQFARIDGLDNKANFIKGTATGLVGIALTLQATVLTSSANSYCTSFLPTFVHTLNPLLKRALPLMPLIITYILVMCLSHLAYKIDNYNEVPTNPEALYEYLQKEVAITKIDIYNRMKVNFKQNEEKINSKACWTKYAFQILELEGIMLVLFLLYRSVC